MFTYAVEDALLTGFDGFLFSRPWWQRVWIIQDVVVCSNSVLHIGDNVINFHGVKFIGDFIFAVLRGAFAHLHREQKRQLGKGCNSILRICASFNVRDLSKTTSATIDDVLRILNNGEAKKASDE